MIVQICVSNLLKLGNDSMAFEPSSRTPEKCSTGFVSIAFASCHIVGNEIDEICNFIIILVKHGDFEPK